MSGRRPVVAVSRCLLGEKVRYDGGDKRNAIVLGVLAERFDFLPFCPEVGIGLPVPRPPMQLVRVGDRVRVLGVDDRQLDTTDALHAYGQELAAQSALVCGFVFKSRSPSCGLASVPLYDVDGEVIGSASGAFAEEIARALPDLPMVEEEQLADPRHCEAFIRRVMVCADSGS